MEMTTETRKTKKAAEAFSDARLTLFRTQPFFARLAMQIDGRPAPDHYQGFIRTDAKSFEYNIHRWIDAPHDRRVYALATLALACGLQHVQRMGDRNKKAWESASRIVTDLILEKSGFMLPVGVSTMAEFEGMNVEQVYSSLPENSSGAGAGIGRDSDTGDDSSDGSAGEKGDDSDSGDDGDSGDGDDYMPEFKETDSGDNGDGGEEFESEHEKSALENKWAQAVEQAKALELASARNHGGDSDALVSSIIKPHTESKKTFVELISQYMDEYAPDDYSYSRMNTRFLYDDLLLPSMHDQAVIGTLVIGIDVSGSMREDAIIKCVESTLQAVKSEKINEIIIVQMAGFLTSVSRIENASEFSPDEFELKRSIGSDYEFVNFFKWLNRDEYHGADEGVQPLPGDSNVKVAVLFSDFVTLWGTETPPCPMIFCSTHVSEKTIRSLCPDDIEFGFIDMRDTSD